jgi:hypothetical protein
VITIPDLRTLTTMQVLMVIGGGAIGLLLLRTVLQRGGPRQRSGSGAVWLMVPLILVAGVGIVWVLVRVLLMMGQSFASIS